VTPERRAAGLVVVAACGFGSLSVGTALASGAGVSLTALMAWRYLLAAPLLVVIGGGIGRLRVPPARAAGLLLLGGAGQSLVTWLSLSSLAWLTAASLGFLFYTYPAWVAILAAAAGLERLTAPRVTALVLALGGITLMVGSPWSSAMPLPGVLRALGSAVVYALYIPVLHRLRGPLDAAVASTYVIAGAAVVFVAAAAGGGVLLTGMTLPMWGIAAGLAAFSTVMAFVCFLQGLAVLGPVRTAILSTVEPFWTALLAALVLAQPVGPGTLGGGLCIVIAILLLQRAPRRAAAVPTPS
jgi:drug/metabolite transporter (DMT)-like permease